MCTSIDRICASIGSSATRIVSVACDTFWHSLLGLDERGVPVTPIFTWADTRSSHAAIELSQRLDEDAVHRRTGCGIHSSYWPAKLAWLQKSDRDAFSLARYWVSFGEFAYLQYFRERRVSISMASATGLLDQNLCSWDEEVLENLPIDERQLSPLHDFSDRFEHLREPYAQRWPALAKIPWYLPLGDGASNSIGSGGFADDQAVVMVGTSGAIRVVREEEQVEIPEGIWTYRVDRRRFVQGGALSAGGNVFAWLTQALHLRDIPTLEDELLEMHADAHGLTVLPFLAGERSPYWSPHARAAIFGLTLDTSDDDIVRACLEAISFRFGLVYEILARTVPSVKGIIGSGAGLIHSPAWMQIMSDVLGKPMVASASPEATCRGAALMTLEAMGVIHDIAELDVPLGVRYVPIPHNTKIYRDAMVRQQALYERLTEFDRSIDVAPPDEPSSQTVM
ncbi:MAG: gluconokinase, partial [Chloroflexota bacterium]